MVGVTPEPIEGEPFTLGILRRASRRETIITYGRSFPHQDPSSSPQVIIVAEGRR